MSYSVKPILHPKEDKNKEHRIYLRVTYDRKKMELRTAHKVPAKFWEGEAVSKKFGDLGKAINAAVEKDKEKIRTLVVKAYSSDVPFDELKTIIERGTVDEIRPAVKLTDFIYDVYDSEMAKCVSEGERKDRHEGIKSWKTIAKNVEDFSPKLTLAQVSHEWLASFELYLKQQRKIDGDALNTNTIDKRLKMLNAMFNKAMKKNLMEEKQYLGYKRPGYTQPIPVWLEPEEITRFGQAIEEIGKRGHTIAGKYFLFSCVTGFRISDMKKFAYDERVQGGKIVLRAKKNGQLVSIPIANPLLVKILAWVKENRFHLSSQKGNDYLKEIAEHAGIKKDIHFHCGRHTFAMSLMDSGFDLDEVAELLGDSKTVARVYARISNKRLEKKFKEAKWQNE